MSFEFSSKSLFEKESFLKIYPLLFILEIIDIASFLSFVNDITKLYFFEKRISV